MNSFELSRNWFDFCFDNPEKVKPVHTALYFFIIEHCNRLGWKDKFGLPMEMAKDAIGVKNYRTYSQTFNDLVEWKFIKVFERSKNQYSANVIGIVKNAKAQSKALSKAMQKHSQKQVHGIVGIDKPITIEPINLLTSSTGEADEEISHIDELGEEESNEPAPAGGPEMLPAEKFIPIPIEACVDKYFSDSSLERTREQLAMRKHMTMDRLRAWAVVFANARVEEGEIAKAMMGREGFVAHFKNWMNYRNSEEDPATFGNPPPAANGVPTGPSGTGQPSKPGKFQSNWEASQKANQLIDQLYEQGNNQTGQ